MLNKIIANSISRHMEYRWQVLMVVMIGTFMAALDSSIVNISIPAMMKAFEAPVHEVEWVITSYLIGFAVFMPVTSWAKERVGQKKLYIFSLFIFTLGSLLCGITNSLGVLIFSRVLQALGGGALTPSAMAMVSKVFKPEERGAAIGIWGLGVVMGPTIGPTLGGYLTEHFGWRSIFLVNIPIGIIGIYLCMILIHDVKEKILKTAFDAVGFFSLTFFLVLFLFGVSQIENPQVNIYWAIILILISFLFLSIFIYFELKEEKPLLDLRLFKNLSYASCVIITFSRTAALYGGLFLLPILLQSILNYSETSSGLFLFPGSLILALMMPFAGKWSDKHGPRGISSVGLFIVTISMFLFALIDEHSTTFYIYFANIVRGIGLGFLVTPIATTAVNSVPYHRITMASSMINLLQQVGGATGVAMIAAFYQLRLNFYAKGDGTDLHLLTQGFQLKAIHESFYIAGILVALTLLPTRFLPNRSEPHKESTEIIHEI